MNKGVWFALAWQKWCQEVPDARDYGNRARFIFFDYSWKAR